MTDQTLPIDDIIRTAKRAGITFGHGNPRAHLAYLTKLRLLPQTVRRKIHDKIQGCYPDWVIPLLKRIEDLRFQGLTYSQIRFQIQTKEVAATPLSPVSLPASHYSSPVPPLLSPQPAVAFLFIGLLLGYLLARVNPSTLPTSLATPAVLDANTKAMLTTSSSPSEQDSSPIYIIALPSQHLDKLGTININELFSGTPIH